MLTDTIAPHELTALVLAAGQGVRFGSQPKAFVTFEESTLLARAVGRVSPWASRIVVAVPKDDLHRAEVVLAPLPESARVTCVAGGATRQATVALALAAATTRYVLLHEVARPWTHEADFRNILRAVKQHAAVALYTPLAERDSIAQIDGDRLGCMIPRNKVVTLQTPHAYDRDLLRTANARALDAGWEESSTAALVQRAGFPVHLVKSVGPNPKVTYPADLDRGDYSRPPPTPGMSLPGE